VIGPDPAVAPASVDPTAHLRPIYAHIDTATYLRQMWQRRSFAYAMPMEEVRATHQDTLLGNVWHLFNPLLSVAVYYIVFGMFLGADRGIPNYLLWLTIGVFAYGLTQRSVLAGATSISSNLGLMRAMRFPRAMLPISTVIGRLITFGFELAALTGVALLTGAGISRRLLVLPLILAIHTTLNLGGAFIAARLNDSYRDVQQVIPFVFQLLRYLSGVMFSVDRFLDDQGAHPWISRLIGLNPLVQILDLYRWVYLGTSIDLARTVEAVGISALVLVFGFRFFRAHELRYGRA
jgi:teichoic acid transport system permease protein